jgi:hypothetical protein
MGSNTDVGPSAGIFRGDPLLIMSVTNVMMKRTLRGPMTVPEEYRRTVLECLDRALR